MWRKRVMKRRTRRSRMMDTESETSSTQTQTYVNNKNNHEKSVNDLPACLAAWQPWAGPTVFSSDPL